MTDEPLVERLERLGWNDLQAEVRRLLQTPPSFVDERPYEPLVDVYRQASRDPAHSALKRSLAATVEELLVNVVRERGNWPPHARANLLALAQRCADAVGMTAMKLADLVSGGNEEDEKLRAGLLKVVLAGPDRGTVAYWEEQQRKLGPRYGALIFSGLALHGLETAMDRLPELSRHAAAARWIALFIPTLVNRFGEEPVARQLAQREENLTPQARALFAPFLERALVAAEPIGKELHEVLYAAR